MNEPWINVASQAKEINGFRYQRTVATDRLGYRQVFNGVTPIFDQRLDSDIPTRSRKIFLLEDSDDDAAIFLRVVRGCSREVAVTRAWSVPQARQLLWGASPDLITLDCHLPGECGLNLLGDIRCHHRLRYVPVVMMSGTENENDVRAAYLLGANSFLKKPVLCEEYVDSVRLLLAYWLDKNRSCASLLPENAFANAAE